MNSTLGIAIVGITVQLLMVALNVALFFGSTSPVRWVNAAAAVVCFGVAVHTTIMTVRHERWMRDFNRKWGRDL